MRKTPYIRIFFGGGKTLWRWLPKLIGNQVHPDWGFKSVNIFWLGGEICIQYGDFSFWDEFNDL